MPRGAKSIEAAVGHRTKAEKESRKKAESAMLTGVKCFERYNVKADSVAHGEYMRLTKLLRKIGKDDALYGASINRYCELYSETNAFKNDVIRYRKMLDDIEERFKELDENGGVEYEQLSDYMKNVNAIIAKISGIDKTIMSKRKMMSDMEKENGWTVLSALRAIPKDAGTKTEKDELVAVLQSED